MRMLLGSLGASLQRLAYIIIALLPLCSALITSYHYHANAKERPDCAICKSAEDLDGGGDQQAPFAPLHERAVFLTVNSDTQSFVLQLVLFKINARPPPVSPFSDQYMLPLAA